MVAERQALAPASAEEQRRGDPQPIRLPPDWELTDERFLEIAQLNSDQLFERTADGRLSQMTWPDVLSRTVAARIMQFVFGWMLEAEGEAYGGDGGYFLPDGSAMAPDISWVDAEQLAEHGPMRGQFRFAPRFVVEVISPSQTVPDQQEKMQNWIANGVRLGWLIDPDTRRVWIYRVDGGVELLEDPPELSGEDVCAGLSIDLGRVWPGE